MRLNFLLMKKLVHIENYTKFLLHLEPLTLALQKAVQTGNNMQKSAQQHTSCSTGVLFQ